MLVARNFQTNGAPCDVSKIEGTFSQVKHLNHSMLLFRFCTEQDLKSPKLAVLDNLFFPKGPGLSVKGLICRNRFATQQRSSQGFTAKLGFVRFNLCI